MPDIPLSDAVDVGILIELIVKNPDFTAVLATLRLIAILIAD